MFKIKALDSQQSKENTHFPRPPFSLLVIGSKGAAKSTTIINMLLNKKIYNKVFNDIYWISPTIFNDEDKLKILLENPMLIQNKLLETILKRNKNMDPLAENNTEIFNPYIPNTNILSELTPEYLSNIIKEQNVVIKKYGKKYANNVLMILDDCLGNDIVKSRIFKQLNVKLRHYKISIIFVSQALFEIPKTVRLNNSCIFLFETNNTKEIQNYYFENNGSLSFNDWIELYKHATEEPYSFFQINYMNDKKHRFLKNMEEFIE